MLKMRIKASQISNLTDARYFAAWGVDWMGFNLNPETEQNLNVHELAAITEWVEGPEMIGEFSSMTDAEQITKVVNDYGLHGLQVGMFAEIALLEKLENQFILQEWVLEKSADLDWLKDRLKERSDYVNVFVLNFSTNQIGVDSLNREEQDALKLICQEFKVLLDTGLSAQNIFQLNESILPHGYCLTGGEEEKVGFKSFDELDEIFEAIEDTV